MRIGRGIFTVGEGVRSALRVIPDALPARKNTEALDGELE